MGEISKSMVVNEEYGHIYEKLTWILRLPVGEGYIRIPASRVGEYLKEWITHKGFTF